MPVSLETDGIRKAQAALEAIEVLQRAGFVVDDFDIDPQAESAKVDLNLSLAISQHERPLQMI